MTTRTTLGFPSYPFLVKKASQSSSDMRHGWSVSVLCGLVALALAQERECECVEYWLCSEGKVITDGTDLLDVRVKSCPGIQVCCLLDENDNEEGPSSSSQSPDSPAPTKAPSRGSGILDIPIISAGGGCGRVRFPPNISTDFKVTGLDGPPETTFYGEAPWMVVILLENKSFKCGGTLISTSVVLTAAHCVHDLPVGDVYVRAGEYDNRIAKKPIVAQSRRASRIAIHPKFNPGNLHNDIALIFLDKEVQTNAVVDIICPPQPEIEIIPSGCVVTGWGRNASAGRYQAIMSKVNLELREREYCLEKLRQSRLGIRFRLHEGFICAGGGDSRDTCAGDGGGPLACPAKRDPNMMVQVGVVSWGIGCGEGYPTVMTSVQFYLPWIHSQIS